jgi:hypothetical protein
VYVGDGTAATLELDLGGVPDHAAALRTGALVTCPTSELYDLGAPIDPAAQLATYDAALGLALADGYTGLRVVADVTPLLIDPARHINHLQWEQCAERYITERSLAALCLYDRRRVTGIDAIVCVHPLHGAEFPAITVHGTGPTAAAATGALDRAAWDVLDDVLATLPSTDERLDVSGISFLDGHSASILQRMVLRRADEGRPLVLSGATPAFRRVWEVCGFAPRLLASS